jgi:hypothetical protein
MIPTPPEIIILKSFLLDVSAQGPGAIIIEVAVAVVLVAFAWRIFRGDGPKKPSAG